MARTPNLSMIFDALTLGPAPQTHAWLACSQRRAPSTWLSRYRGSWPSFGTKVFSGQTFHPETDKRTFRIGVSDQTEAAPMRDVLSKLQQRAPSIQVVARSVEMRLASELLANGAIDVAMGCFPDFQQDIETSILYHESFVCVFDPQACGVQGPVTLDDYTALPHILVSLRGEPFGHIDELLRAVGRQRTSFTRRRTFSPCRFLLHGFRAGSALPRHLAENCAEAAGFAICPIPLVGGYDVRMVWHRPTRATVAENAHRRGGKNPGVIINLSNPLIAKIDLTDMLRLSILSSSIPELKNDPSLQIATLTTG